MIGPSPKNTARTRLIAIAPMSQAAMMAQMAMATIFLTLRGGLASASGIARLYRRPIGRSSLAAALLVGSGGLAAGSARADTVEVDVQDGPVVAGSRAIGMGGAAVGVAEGTDHFFFNPASLASRSWRSSDWFDYDLSLDWLISPGGSIDHDNDGEPIDADTTLSNVTAGFALNLGHLALGLSFKTTGYAVDQGSGALDVNASTVLFGLAWAFADGEWTAGLAWGVRAADMRWVDVDEEAVVEDHAEYSQGALNLGLLWRPEALPYRLGVSFRFPSSPAPLAPPDGEEFAGRPYVTNVHFPWRLSIGGSYLWSSQNARPYNQPVKGAEWGEDRDIEDRRYLLVAMDVSVVGASPAEGEVVGLESWVAREPTRAGHFAGWSLRLGAESEVVHDRLKIRVGTYSEPSRAHNDLLGHLGRWHLTGGAEVRLFDLWIVRIKLGAGFDLSTRYQNILFGVGFWN